MPEQPPIGRLPLSVFAFGLLFALGAVPAVLVAEWTALRHAAEVEDERLRAMETLAGGLARLSADYLSESASKVDRIGRAIEEIEDEAGSPDELGSFLEGQVVAEDSFRRLILVDSTGRPLAAAQTDLLPASTALASAEQELVRTSLRTGETAWSSGFDGGLAVGTPLRDTRGELRAVLLGELRQAPLEDRLLAASATSRARLVDRSGRVLIDTAGSSDDALGLPLRDASCTSSSRDLRGPSEDSSIATCVPIELPTELRLWVSESASEVSAQIRARTRPTRQATWLHLLLVGLMSIFLARAISRFMARLEPKVDRLGEGALDISLVSSTAWTPRELAGLRTAAHRMLSRMQANRARTEALLEALETANRKLSPLAAAWDQIDEAVEILDHRGHILFANPACVDALGAEATAVGRPSSLLKDERGAMLFLALKAHRAWTGEVEIDGPRGRRLHAITASPVVDDGTLQRIVVIRRDLTEQRAAESVAAHSARLASIGTLAAGLAHEINNPLTYVRMHLETLAESAEHLSLPQMGATTSDCIDGIDHIGRVVKGLLLVARHRDPSAAGDLRESVEVAQLIDSAVALSGTRFKDRASIETELTEGLEVSARVPELTQVLINLIVNAGLAYPKGDARQQRVQVRAGRTPETLVEPATVWIEVEDQGSGMSPEVLDRIFEPFFTTRPVGQGTGLGLAVSRSIVAAHGGTLEARSTLGEGSCFRLRLPVHTGRTLPPMAPVPTPPAQLKVLVVDDEPLVARTIARILGDHDVRVAIGGAAALDALEVELADVILSDVMMPGLNGPMLYDEVVARWPALANRLAFITGAPRGSSVLRAVNQTGRPVLHKPVERTTLERCVQRLASAARPSP